MTELQRKVDFIGAYDFHTGLKPGQRSFGIHNMTIQFAVIGPRGAISINLSTNWFLPAQQISSQLMYSKHPWEPGHLCRPDFTDVGYHAHAPQNEWQVESGPNQAKCHLLDGPCYYDGSSLWGNEEWRDGFLHGGSDWLFEKMEEEYRHRFEDGPMPDLTPIPRVHPDDARALGEEK